MTSIIPNIDHCHVLKILCSFTLLVKFKVMSSKRNSGTPIPKEVPPVQPQPEIKPPVEPVSPGIPVEDPIIKPAERPDEISPYDFPPPGEGMFPEIF